MLWTPRLAKYSVLSKRKTDTSRSSPTTKHTSESLLTPTPIPETAEIRQVSHFFIICMTLCFKITEKQVKVIPDIVDIAVIVHKATSWTWTLFPSICRSKMSISNTCNLVLKRYSFDVSTRNNSPVKTFLLVPDWAVLLQVRGLCRPQTWWK